MNYYEKSKEKTVELCYDYVKIGGFCPFGGGTGVKPKNLPAEVINNERYE